MTYQVERAALVNAIHRCHNEEHPAYKNYGARGIAVCDDWRRQGGWQDFVAHIGPKPSPELSLDRIDNDGCYEPGNVRWATRKAQQQNRRPVSQETRTLKVTNPVTIGGVTKGISQWATEFGLDAVTISYRIKVGFSGRDLIAAPHTLPRSRGAA